MVRLLRWQYTVSCVDCVDCGRSGSCVCGISERPLIDGETQSVGSTGAKRLQSVDCVYCGPSVWVESVNAPRDTVRCIDWGQVIAVG